MLKLSVLMSVFLLSLTSVKAMEAMEVDEDKSLKIFAINSYYNLPIRMEIGIVYKDGRDFESKSFILPSSEQRDFESKSFILPSSEQNLQPCFEVSNRNDISNIFINCHNGLFPLDNDTTVVAMRTLNTTEIPLSNKYLGVKVEHINLRGKITNNLASLSEFLSSANCDSER